MLPLVLVLALLAGCASTTVPTNAPISVPSHAEPFEPASFASEIERSFWPELKRYMRAVHQHDVTKEQWEFATYYLSLSPERQEFVGKMMEEQSIDMPPPLPPMYAPQSMITPMPMPLSCTSMPMGTWTVTDCY